MKPIKIQNEHGETIEIKYNADGVIKIRHSDIDPKFWGELHEYAKRLRQAAVQSFFAQKGIDPTNSFTKEVGAKLGGYIVLRGQSYMVSADEIALIHGAVKQRGGILPNWSSQA